uniref:G protein pathway suppressor 2 n=1 Tax=Ciona savignyi TaxID=51511 RepID=H2Y7S2_CIOSA
MPVLLEREKTNPLMQKALQIHIIQEREKRKQEAAEAEKDFERKAKEEEEKRKKIEEENSTLEEIKEQLIKLKEREDALRQDKHQLFWQFKRVLHEEGKRKERLREQSDMNTFSSERFQTQGMALGPHHLLTQARYSTHPQQGPYAAAVPQNVQSISGSQAMQQGIKRPHSPTATSSGMHQRQAMMPSTAPNKYDFSGHSNLSYLSPARSGAHHSVASTPPGRIHNPYQTPERVSQSGTGKETPTYLEETRPRIRMLPQNFISHQLATSPFSSSNHLVRSNSPGRFPPKPEPELVLMTNPVN